MHLPLSRENRKLVLVATACITVSLAAPSVASAAKHVVDAKKVDGLSAVHSSASVKARKGKLVATDPKTGRLPNNIIAVAPKATTATNAANAAELGGVTPAQLRFLSIDAQAAHVSGGASRSSGYGRFSGIVLPNGGVFSNAFVVPPDYRTGDPIRLTLEVSEDSTSCYASLLPDSLSVGRPGQTFADGPSADSGLANVGTVSFGATADQITPDVFTITSPETAKPIVAGSIVTYTIYRGNGDTCADDLYVNGESLTY